MILSEICLKRSTKQRTTLMRLRVIDAWKMSGNWRSRRASEQCRSSPPSSAKADGTTQSLGDFLHPVTFYLRLLSVEGRRQATKIEDTENYASMHETGCLPMDCVPLSVHSLIPAVELDFLDELFMGKVVKVSHNGEVYVFKSASYGSEDQLQREIVMLQQVSERWEPGRRNRPRIPRLLGLVTARNNIAGLLEEYVDGENLSELDMADVSPAQRRK